MKLKFQPRMILAGFAFFFLLLYSMAALSRLHETQVDDAYMFLRYAKHWLSGNGFSWNVGDGPVYGTTSVLHLLMVTVVRGLTNLSDTVVLTSTSYVSALASILVLPIIGFVLFEHLRENWLPLFVIPATIVSPLFLAHSVSGMDTALAVLTNSVFAGSAFYYSKYRSRSSFFLCLAAAYLAYLTRPDSGLYCVLIPFLLIIADDIRQWKQALIYVAVFFLIICGDLFIKKLVFGDWVALSFFAKSSGFYRGYIGPWKWMAGYETLLFLRTSLPYIVLMTIFVSRRTFLQLAAILLPVFLTFCYFATVIQIMGYGARYYYPAIPFFVMGAYVASNDYMKYRLVAPLKKDVFLRLRITAALIMSIGLFLPQTEKAVNYIWRDWFVGEAEIYQAKTHYTTRSSEVLPNLGWWVSLREMNTLMQNLPPGIVLAASEYGYIGSNYPTTTIIDLVGLHDRYIAYNGFSESYVFSKKPDVIWFAHPDYTYIVSVMLDSPTFVENYDFYPNAYDYGLAVRRNTGFSADITKALEKEFSRIYPGRILSGYKAFVGK